MTLYSGSIQIGIVYLTAVSLGMLAECCHLPKPDDIPERPHTEAKMIQDGFTAPFTSGVQLTKFVRFG